VRPAVVKNVDERLLSALAVTTSCAVISGLPFAIPVFDLSNLIASFSARTKFYVEEGAMVQSHRDLGLARGAGKDRYRA
jgi:hypothetical protein